MSIWDIEEGYYLVNSRNYRVLEVDYEKEEVLCYWVGRPDDKQMLKPEHFEKKL